MATNEYTDFRKHNKYNRIEYKWNLNLKLQFEYPIELRKIKENKY